MPNTHVDIYHLASSRNRGVRRLLDHTIETVQNCSSVSIDHSHCHLGTLSLASTGAGYAVREARSVRGMDRGGRCRVRSRGPGPEGEAGGGVRGEGGGGGARPPAPHTRALPQGRPLGGDAASEGEAGATSNGFAFNHRQHVEMEMPFTCNTRKVANHLRRSLIHHSLL